MKSNIFRICAGAMLLFLVAGTVEKAQAQVVVVRPSATVEVMYDDRGIPIWGYGTRGRAIYAYSPEGLPVYAYERVYSGCYVPTWDPQPHYRGPVWPRGIHRVRYGAIPRVRGVHHVVPGPRPGGHGPAAGPGRPGGHGPAVGPGRPGGHGGPGGPGGPGGHGGPGGGPRR